MALAILPRGSAVFSHKKGSHSSWWSQTIDLMMTLWKLCGWRPAIGHGSKSTVSGWAWQETGTGAGPGRTPLVAIFHQDDVMLPGHLESSRGFLRS